MRTKKHSPRSQGLAPASWKGILTTSNLESRMLGKSSLPPFEAYFPATVQAMKARGGSATIEEMEEDVAKIKNLSEQQLAIPHKSGTRSQFQYSLAWVRT